MASITLTLTGNSSRLQAQYFPSIDLSDGDYVCGLIDFQTFNSIPNVDETNNLFHFEENRTVIKRSVNIDDIQTAKLIRRNPTSSSSSSSSVEKVLSHLEIPTGSYEVNDLARFLKKYLTAKEVEIELNANKNTLQCELVCSQPVDFSKPRSIGPLLGFRNNTILVENTLHISPLPADILKVNVIRIECDIVAGSYLNDQPSHTIHEFSPRVPPGYKIIEVPQNVIYFPVTVKNIHALNLSIIDQNNRLINFRGETITIRLHIKKLN